jgi:hypothetical protein
MIFGLVNIKFEIMAERSVSGLVGGTFQEFAWSD